MALSNPPRLPDLRRKFRKGFVTKRRIVVSSPAATASAVGFSAAPSSMATVDKIDGTNDAFNTQLLALFGNDITTLDFADPVTVANDVNFTNAALKLTQARFQKLQSVGGQLAFDGCALLTHCAADKLVSVGGRLSLVDCSVLQQASFAKLVSVTSEFTFTGTSVLTSLSIPKLQSVQNLEFSTSGLLVLNAPALTEFTSLSGQSINGDGTLQQLLLPALPEQFDLFSVGNLDSLTGLQVLNIASITTVTTFDLSTVPLATLVITGLASVTDQFSVLNSNLTEVLAPALVTVGGNVDFSGTTSLQNVSMPVWVPTSGTTINFSGCALSAAAVNHILARCVASGVTGCTISLNGGTNAAPTGQGIVDAAALVTAGNTVNTN